MVVAYIFNPVLVIMYRRFAEVHDEVPTPLRIFVLLGTLLIFSVVIFDFRYLLTLIFPILFKLSRSHGDTDSCYKVTVFDSLSTLKMSCKAI